MRLINCLLFRWGRTVTTPNRSSSPSCHRNERSKRARARKTIRAANEGAPISAQRLAAAKQLLASHHASVGMTFESKHWWCPSGCVECLTDGSERALRFSKSVATCSKCGEDQLVDKELVEIQSKLKQRPELAAALGFCKCTCVHSVVFAPPPADGITPTHPTPHSRITPSVTPARKRLAVINCSTVSVGPNSNNS